MSVALLVLTMLCMGRWPHRCLSDSLITVIDRAAWEMHNTHVCPAVFVCGLPQRKDAVPNWSFYQIHILWVLTSVSHPFTLSDLDGGGCVGGPSGGGRRSGPGEWPNVSPFLHQPGFQSSKNALWFCISSLNPARLNTSESKPTSQIQTGVVLMESWL